MRRERSELAGWTIAIGTLIVALLAAPLLIASAATLILAALWCLKLDREEYAVQVLGSESPAVNL